MCLGFFSRPGRAKWLGITNTEIRTRIGQRVVLLQTAALHLDVGHDDVDFDSGELVAGPASLGIMQEHAVDVGEGVLENSGNHAADRDWTIARMPQNEGVAWSNQALKGVQRL